MLKQRYVEWYTIKRFHSYEPSNNLILQTIAGENKAQDIMSSGIL